MSTFEDRAQSIVDTATELARLQNQASEYLVLHSCRPRLVQTGTDSDFGERSNLFALVLEIPVEDYAIIEDERPVLENMIRDRVKNIIRPAMGNYITEVIISPQIAEATKHEEFDEGEKAEEIPSFWAPGFFRLFISHTTENKKSAHNLKSALARYQVAAFVAHDDIIPTKEWQAEIELALRTMDSMTAIITADFCESRWCDQEVGIAIGRGKLIIPLRKGADPHGFLGKYQGVQAQGLDALGVAEKVVEILMTHSLSTERMGDALVERMVTSLTWEDARATMKLLEKLPRLNSYQTTKLVQSIEQNAKVKEAYYVPDRIKQLVSKNQRTATKAGA